MKRCLLLGGFVLGLLAFVGALVVVLGLAPIKASSGHWAITEWFLKFSMKQSVATYAIGLDPPPLNDPGLVIQGAGHYETGCRFCHGAPGEPLPVVPHHMTPHPPRLAESVREYDDAELFFIVKHGVKFTGMPAWPAQDRDDEVWAVTAFLRRYPELDRESYHRLVHGGHSQEADAPELVVERCARCHGVDGLGRGEGVFPKLAGQRPRYLANSLAAYAGGERHSGLMKPIAGLLSRSEVDTAVRWYAEQPPFSGEGETDGLGRQIALEGIPERRIAACTGCHGPKEAPHNPAYPRLAGQYERYLALQLELFTKGVRGGSEWVELMKDALSGHALEPHEIRAVARYYASLPAEGE